MNKKISSFENVPEELYKETIDQIFDFEFETVFNYRTDSFHLSDQLTGLRKKELSRIAKYLKIDGLSSLDKTELREALVEKIPVYQEKMLNYLAEYNYRLLLEILKKGKQDFLIKDYELGDIELGAYLFSYALAFPAFSDYGLHFFIPNSTIELLQDKLETSEYKKTIMSNWEILMNSWSLLYFYGTIPQHELYDILKNYMQVDFSFDYYCRLLEFNSNFHNIFLYGENQVAIENVYEPQEIYFEQSKHDFEYALIPKHEFEEIRKNGKHLYNFAQKRLQKFLKKNYELNKEQAADLVRYICLSIQNQLSQDEIIEHLSTFLSFEDPKDLEQILDLSKAVKNQTRLWVLKGHRSAEFN